MEKELRLILAGKCHNDLATNAAIEQILDLFNSVKRFRASWEEENGKEIEEYFWAKDKDEASKQVFKKYPDAKNVMI